MKKIVFFIMLIFVLMPCAVSASFHAGEGYDIPDEDYQKLRNFYTDASLYTMPYDKYNELITSNINFDTFQQETKYIYTICDSYTNVCEDMEITEEEYKTGNVYLPVPYQSSTYPTTSKQLTLTLSTPSNGAVYFTLYNQWSPNHLPVVRSFDVIGIRIGNFEVVNGTQTGTQVYQQNGVYKSVDYAANGTNISNQSLGFGISMNLVDDSTFFQNSIEGYLQINATPAVIYGSYQHAVVNVDLATSKSYTIGAGGLGSVFKFSSTVQNYYDKMGGTYLDILSV